MQNREHCLAVKELYCHKEWLVLEGSSSVQPGIFSSATGSHTPSSLLPNCQALPSLHTDPDACTHVPFVGKISITVSVVWCLRKASITQDVNTSISRTQRMVYLCWFWHKFTDTSEKLVGVCVELTVCSDATDKCILFLESNESIIS